MPIREMVFAEKSRPEWQKTSYPACYGKHCRAFRLHSHSPVGFVATIDTTYIDKQFYSE